MGVTGSDANSPTRAGVPSADVLSGVSGVHGVPAALHERDRRGRGQPVRASLLASMCGIRTSEGTRHLVAGDVRVPAGNHHRTPSALQQVHHATLGDIELPGNPVWPSRTRRHDAPPPPLGEHFERLRSWLAATPRPTGSTLQENER